jgi:hypothetical protein
VVPGAFPHPATELGLALGVGTASALPGPCDLAQLGEVGCHRLVLRCAHRLYPAGQHPRPLGPLEQHVRVARVGGELEGADAQSSTLADDVGLEIDAAERALPFVELAEPGAQVGEGTLALSA